jgi:hypothetical protein
MQNYQTLDECRPGRLQSCSMRKSPKYSNATIQQTAILAGASSPTVASLIAQIPRETIRYWLYHFETMSDSEADAFKASKRRMSGLLWSTLEELALRRCVEIVMSDGSMKDLQSATVSAGICDTKLSAAGQPKVIDQASIAPTSLDTTPDDAAPVDSSTQE